MTWELSRHESYMKFRSGLSDDAVTGTLFSLAVSRPHRRRSSEKIVSGLSPVRTKERQTSTGVEVCVITRHSLELEPRSELHPAEVVGRGSDLTQGAVSRPQIREGKALMIEGIEHFGANLQDLALPDRKLLG